MHLEHDHDCIQTHDHPHTSTPRDELIALIPRFVYCAKIAPQ